MKSQRNRSVRIWFTAVLLLVFFFLFLSRLNRRFVRTFTTMRPSTDGHLTVTFFNAIRLLLCVCPIIAKDEMFAHKIKKQQQQQLTNKRFTSTYFPLNNALNDAAKDKHYMPIERKKRITDL